MTIESFKMETVTINADSGPSRILIGERLENLQRYIPVAKPIIITDVTVGKLYPLDSMAAEVITIGTGEGIKTLDTVQRNLWAQLLSSRGGSFILYRRHGWRHRVRYCRICGVDLSARSAVWFCSHPPCWLRWMPVSVEKTVLISKDTKIWSGCFISLNLSSVILNY